MGIDKDRIMYRVHQKLKNTHMAAYDKDGKKTDGEEIYPDNIDDVLSDTAKAIRKYEEAKLGLEEELETMAANGASELEQYRYMSSRLDGITNDFKTSMGSIGVHFDVPNASHTGETIKLDDLASSSTIYEDVQKEDADEEKKEIAFEIEQAADAEEELEDDDEFVFKLNK